MLEKDAIQHHFDGHCAGESWYGRLFARIYDPLLAAAERDSLGWHRRHLLNQAEGRILEVGCGTGVNFGFYHPDRKVDAFDPSPAMLAQAAEKARLAPAQIQLEHCGIDEYQPAHTYDTIVATLVLCTVPDLERSLARLQDWLRPGGRLLILEHIRSHKKRTALWQGMLRPAWACVGQGCQLNRATDQHLLQHAAFQQQELVYFQNSLPFMRGVFLRRPEPKQEPRLPIL
ncbi:MAG: class I SAM-dependent methyltransferase [Leptospiraceae bacterium]|nr:class I SAM-dependent methyltransferase [Leptospiraceae bacterium]